MKIEKDITKEEFLNAIREGTKDAIIAMTQVSKFDDQLILYKCDETLRNIADEAHKQNQELYNAQRAYNNIGFIPTKSFIRPFEYVTYVRSLSMDPIHLATLTPQQRGMILTRNAVHWARRNNDVEFQFKGFRVNNG